MKQHYTTLGLQEGASQEEIQAAYDKLSKELDPANNNNQEFFIEEYKDLQAAYKALSASSILATKQGAKKPKKNTLKPGYPNAENSPTLLKNKSLNHKKSKFMKTYSKIVGIILTLIFLIGFCLITFFIIDNSNLEENLFACLLYIPCIAFLHYMYLHNFGFNLNSMIPKTKYRIILFLSIISFVAVLIMPTSYFFKQYRVVESLDKTIDRGENDKGDYLASLKTKYNNNAMYYVLDLKTPDNSKLPLKYKTFQLNLFDKDGFKLVSFKLDSGKTNLVNDNNQKYGLIVNSSSYMDNEIYLKVVDWNLTYYR